MERLRTEPYCGMHRPEGWRGMTMRRVYTEKKKNVIFLVSQNLAPVYNNKEIILALIVTRLPLGFFSKSSRSTFSPTMSTAEGKCSLKKVAADSRVLSNSREENGMNKVRVKEPS